MLRWLEEMSSNGKTILEVLSREYFLVDHLTTHEMRLFEYLQHYVSTLNVESSKVFLKYVTGMEVLRIDISIKVLFNGEVELETRFHKAIHVHRRCIY